MHITILATSNTFSLEFLESSQLVDLTESLVFPFRLDVTEPLLRELEVLVNLKELINELVLSLTFGKSPRVEFSRTLNDGSDLEVLRELDLFLRFVDVLRIKMLSQLNRHQIILELRSNLLPLHSLPIL